MMRIVVLLGLLAVTALPVVTASAQTNQELIIYQLDFEDNHTFGMIDWWNQWHFSSDETGNHIYCNQKSEEWASVQFGRDGWTDYAVEVDAMFVDQIATQALELYARLDDDWVGYRGTLSFGEARLGFYSPWRDLGSQAINTQANTWYTLRIEVTGDRITFYIDGKLISDKKNTGHSHGFAGIGAGPNSQVCIDNVRVMAMGALANQLQADVKDLSVQERLAAHSYPKIYLQHQDWFVKDATLDEMAYWDLLALSIDLGTADPTAFGRTGRIRQINPNAVVLFYFIPFEICPDTANTFDQKFNSLVREEWYLRDIEGQYVRYWQCGDERSRVLNLATPINTFIPEFLDEYVDMSLWDGIYYDWISPDITVLYTAQFLPNGLIDIDNDGKAERDNDLNQPWIEGTRALLENTWAMLPAGKLIIGNGGGEFDTEYADLLNGRMVEGFMEYETAFGITWLDGMRSYYMSHELSREPKVSLIMANGDRDDFKHMRFTLASTLMFDGYFSYDNPQLDLTQLDVTIGEPYISTWWYDEYSVDLATGEAVRSLEHKGYLGEPLLNAYSPQNINQLLAPLLVDNNPAAEQYVWRRDFENGIALVNPSHVSQVIDLKDTFNKIKGVIDPGFNDGQSLTAITLAPRSGAILLRPPGTIPDFASLNAETITVITVTSSSAVNLQDGPGINEPIVGLAASDEKFDVISLSEDRSWLQIRTVSGLPAWIAAFLTDFNDG